MEIERLDFGEKFDYVMMGRITGNPYAWKHLSHLSCEATHNQRRIFRLKLNFTRRKVFSWL